MSGSPPAPSSAQAPCTLSASPRPLAELLSDDTRAVWSPRLSPDRCRIAYLENSALGPHQQCSRLLMVSIWAPKRTRGGSEGAGGQDGTRQSPPGPCVPQYDWYTEQTRTVLEAVPRQAWGEYGPAGSSGEMGCWGC